MMPCTLLISLYTVILFKTYNDFSNYIWILIEYFVIIYVTILIIMPDMIYTKSDILFIILFVIIYSAQEMHHKPIYPKKAIIFIDNQII